MAAKPVALGVDEVPPLRLTVRLLYAVVPPVPFKFARETKIPSTLACVSFIPVIVTFPPILNNPELKLNVVILAATIINVEVIVNNAGKDKETNAFNCQVAAPVTVCNAVSVNVVAAAHVIVKPGLETNAGRATDVNEDAMIVVAPPVVCKLVNVKVVKAVELI